MYERIVVAIDHSQASERVVAAARDLALLSSGEVWVVHVRERQAPGKFAPPVDIETADDAQQQVEGAVARLSGAGVKAHAEIGHAFYGHAAAEIVACAGKHDAGVIVMGSKGHSDLAALLLGSTAHKVIQLADRPVLVVR